MDDSEFDSESESELESESMPGYDGSDASGGDSDGGGARNRDETRAAARKGQPPSKGSKAAVRGVAVGPAHVMLPARVQCSS
eukprot:321135-Chlamydomonas_euryale.AAC.1